MSGVSGQFCSITTITYGYNEYGEGYGCTSECVGSPRFFPLRPFVIL